MGLAEISRAVTKESGRLLTSPPAMLVQAPGVVFDRVFLDRAVLHALLAVIGPENGGSIPFEALSAKASEMVPVGAMDSRCELRRPCLRISALTSLGRREAEVAAGQVKLGVEQREGAAFLASSTEVQVGRVAHEFADAGSHRTRFGLVVAQAEHGQGVAGPVKPRPTRTLVGGFLLLAFERPVGGIQHVIEHAGRDADDFGEIVEIELGLLGERVLTYRGQVDRTQAAAAIGRQRLFGAGVGGLDGLAVVRLLSLFMRSRNRMPGSAWS